MGLCVSGALCVLVCPRVWLSGARCVSVCECLGVICKYWHMLYLVYISVHVSMVRSCVARVSRVGRVTRSCTGVARCGV